MEEVIIAILQAVFEFVLEIFSFVPFDWPSRSRSSPESDDVGLNCFYWFVIGCGLACSSMLFLRHTWISLSILRLANLVLAPIVSAFFSRGHRPPTQPPQPKHQSAQAFLAGVLVYAWSCQCPIRLRHPALAVYHPFSGNGAGRLAGDLCW